MTAQLGTSDCRKGWWVVGDIFPLSASKRARNVLVRGTWLKGWALSSFPHDRGPGKTPLPHTRLRENEGAKGRPISCTKVHQNRTWPCRVQVCAKMTGSRKALLGTSLHVESYPLPGSLVKQLSSKPKSHKY